VNKGSITTPHDDGSSTAVSGADGDVSMAAGRDVTGMQARCGDWDDGGDGVDDAGDDAAAAAAAAAAGDVDGGIVYEVADEPLEEASDPMDLDTAAIEGLRFSAAAPPLSPAAAAAAAPAAVTASVADTKVATAEGATEDTTEEGETENAEGATEELTSVERCAEESTDGADGTTDIDNGDVSSVSGHDVTSMNVKCGDWDDGGDGVDDAGGDATAAYGDAGHTVKVSAVQDELYQRQCVA
jgi:hypothetical protein